MLKSRSYIILILFFFYGQILFGQSDTSLQLIENIDELPDSIKIIELKNRALSYADISLSIGIDYAEQIMVLALRSNDSALISDTYNVYGRLNYAAGFNEIALTNFTSSYNIYRSIEDLEGMWKTTHNIGLTYFEMKDTSQCLMYYSESINYRLQSGIPERIGDGYTTIGEAYLYYGDYARSFENLSKALINYNGNYNYERKIECLALICENLLRKKNQDAIIYIRHLEEESLLYNKDIVSLINFFYSRFYLIAGDLSRSEIYLSNVDRDKIDGYEFLDIPGYFDEISLSLRSSGFEKKALEYAILAREINYGKDAIEVKNIITNFKTRLDLSTAEERLINRQQVNELILQRIRIDRIFKLFLIAISSILGILLLNISYSLFAIRKSSIALVRRKSELEEAYQRSLKYESSILNIRENKNLFFSVITEKLSGPFSQLCRDIEESNEALISGAEQNEYVKLLSGINTRSITIEKKLKRVLLWSKLQRNKYEVHKIRINVNDYLHELLPDILAMALKKEIRVRYDIDPSLIIEFDRHSFKSILRILIENSVDSSESRTEIILRGQKARSGTIISVTDFGKGIDSIYQENIFDIKRENGDTWNEGKLGLGLIIARLLAEINNSYISFESNPRKGTTFFIHIKKQNG